MTDPYVYPGTSVLRNHFELRDQAALDQAERWHVTQRLAEGCPTGKFDLAHLRAIHRHLFHDVYPWAGEVRTVQLSKGGSTFLPARFIEQGMADVHARLQARKLLQGLDRSAFVREAAAIFGDVNHVHPFREGNGRVQIQYLLQLARQAGHPLEVRRIKPDRWLDASIRANRGDHLGLARVLHRAVTAKERFEEARQLRREEHARRFVRGR